MPNFQPYVPGPTPIFASVSNSSTPRLLGTCEGGVQIDLEHRFVPFMNDIGGQSLSTDEQFDGVECMISGMLTIFDWAVLESISAVPSTSSTPGTSIFGDIGTLTNYESCSVQIWAKFPYIVKAQYSGSMIAGYHLFSAQFAGPKMNASSKAVRIPVSFGGKRKLLSGGVLKSYDHDMTGCVFPP
jgi:hypothetical protein